MRIKKIIEKKIIMTLVFSVFCVNLSVLSYPKNAAAVGLGIPVMDVAAEMSLTQHTAILTGILQQGTLTAVQGATTAASTFTSAASLTVANLKTYLLTPLVRSFAQMLIRQITQDTVEWINGGFKGSPGFMNNPTQFLTNTVDEALGSYLSGAGLNWMCKSFGTNIKIALYQRNYTYIPPQCSLSTMANNTVNSIQNSSISIDSSSNGGTITVGDKPGATVTGNQPGLGQIQVQSWGDFMNETAEPTNSPVVAMMEAASQVRQAMNTAVDKVNDELSLGNGFFSWKDCKVYETGPLECIEYDLTTRECSKTAERKCLQEEVKTPGSVLSAQLNTVLPTDLRQLEMAKEIDEVMGAITGALMKKVVSESGLLDASKKDSNGISWIAANFQEADTRGAKKRASIQSDWTSQQNEMSAALSAEKDSEAVQYNAVAADPNYQAKLTGGKYNVAKGKSASQSSTDGSYVSSLAVDGNKISGTEGATYYSSTKTETAPWWKVDLTDYYRISEIKVWVKSSSSVSKNSKYVAKIYDANNKIVWTSSEATLGDDTTDLSMISFPVSSSVAGLLSSADSPVNGSVVSIQKTDGGSLQLVEVEVWAKDVKMTFTDNNNLSVNISKGASQENNIFQKTLAFSSDGPLSNLRVVTSLYKKTNNTNVQPSDYLNISSIFDTLETTIDKKGSQLSSNAGVQEILLPATRLVISAPLIEVTNGLSIETDYDYGLTYNGVLKSSMQIPVGNFILHSEIRDKNNNPIGSQDISFTVSVL